MMAENKNRIKKVTRVVLGKPDRQYADSLVAIISIDKAYNLNETLYSRLKQTALTRTQQELR